MDRNLARDILLRIDKINVGESILIDDLNKEFPDVDANKFLNIISRLVAKYYVRLDGKFSYELYGIEKYNKIIGLDRDGFEAIDYIKNDRLWSKLEHYLEENGYNDFSIFNVVEISKQLLEKEIEQNYDKIMKWIK